MIQLIVGIIIGLLFGSQFYLGERRLRKHTEEVNDRLKSDILFWEKYCQKLEMEKEQQSK